MKDERKTKKQLISELEELRQRTAGLNDADPERSQIEDALRIERDNLNNIFEAMEDGIYIVNQHYDIQYVNPVLVKDFGVYEGRKCYEYFHDRTEVCPWCKNPDVFAGKTVRREWFSNKTDKTYDLIATPMKNPDGSISKLEIFRDITERVRIEQELRQKEARLAEAQRMAHIGSYEFDVPDGEIIWSEETFRILDRDPSLGEPSIDEYMQIIHPEDRSQVEEIVAQAVNEKQPFDFEYRVIVENGMLKYLQSVGEPAMDENGTVERIVGTILDITERVQAENALRESERQLKEAQEIARIGRWEFDIDTQKITWSNQVFKLYERDPSLGEPTPEEEATYYPPEDSARLREYARRAIEEGKSAEYDFQVQLPSGKTSYMTALMRPITDESSRVVKLVGSVQDITKRKRAMRKILQQQEEMNTILDSVPALIFYKDREDRFIRVNKALAQAFNMSVEEIIGKTAAELSPAKDYWEDDKRVMETGIPLRKIVEPMETPEGTKWAQTDKIPYKDPDGNIAGIIGLAIDITARKQAEEALQRQAERLKTLRDIDHAILSAKSPADIAQAAINQLKELIGATRVSVVLFEIADEVNILATVSAGSTAGIGPGMKVPSEDYVIGEELLRGEIHIVDDIEDLPRPSPVDLMILSEGVRSYVNLPLLIQDELIGAINIGFDLRESFAEEEIEIAAEVANSLAIAIHQANLFEQVQVGRGRLQKLSRRLVEAQEAERRYIAQELHDEIGQLLTGLKLTVQMSKELLSEEGKKELEQADELLEELLTQVRDLSLDLRPSMLDDLGLLPALLWQIDRFQGQTGIHVDFKHSGLTDERFIPELETTAYRIVQEALTNVARHANAEEVKVIAEVAHNTLTLHVSDEGTGFDISQSTDIQTSLGLIGMRERAIMLGGSFEIETEVGKGTMITAELPIDGRLERRQGERGK